MLLQNEFEVDAPIDDAWRVLTDLGRVVPCMPGAALQRNDGETCAGSIKVKVGPIGAQFHGTAAFVEKDAAAYRARLEASGQDPRGHATASARVDARLEPVTATRTRVLIDSDLEISGRIAQFGRGAIGDVSTRLLAQFASNLGTQLTPAGPAPGTVVRPGPTPEAGVDALALVLPTLRARYAQALAGGLLGFALSWVAFGRKARS
jgi:hypothetical protein